MKSENKLISIAVLAVFLLIGCGDDDAPGDSEYEIDSGPLSGTINGEPFEAVDGRAMRMAFLEPDEYGVEFYGTEPEGGDSCASRGLEPHLSFILKEDEVGEFDLRGRGFAWTTYEDDVTNSGITYLGKLVINSIDGTIVGGAHAVWQNPETVGQVSGEFEVPICDE